MGKTKGVSRYKMVSYIYTVHKLVASQEFQTESTVATYLFKNEGLGGDLTVAQFPGPKDIGQVMEYSVDSKEAPAHKTLL